MLTTILSRIITLFMSIAILFSGGRSDRVQLKVTNTVTSTERLIEYEITNYSGVPISTGDRCKIEKFVDDEWTDRWFDPEGKYFISNDISYTILPYTSFKRSVLPTSFNFPLDEGLYRLSKEYNSIYGVGIMTTTFTVSE